MDPHDVRNIGRKCPRCGDPFIFGVGHRCQAPPLARDNDVGRIADALERIADELERKM